MPLSSQQQIDIDARRTALLQARREKKSFNDIWQELGYSSRGDATKDYWRVRQQYQKEFAAERSLLQQEAREELDDLLAAVWAKAMAGDISAHDQALKTMGLKIKLDGLDRIPAEDGIDDAKSMLAKIGEAFATLAGALPPEGDE
jgi:hypothetical protein